MTGTTEMLSNNTAAIVDQSLMAFGAGMSLQSRTDVKNAYHFASLVASKRFDQEGQGEEWFKAFLKVMHDCGWVTARRCYEQVNQGSQSLKVGAIAAKAVSSIGTAFLGGPVGAALNKLAESALEKLGMVDEAQQLLKRNIKNKANASVGLASCIETNTGEVVLVMSAVQVAAASHDLDLAVFEWASSSLTSYTGSAALSFNKTLYDHLRPTIELKLGERAINNVLDYDI
ncbi:hypothetical protein KC131_06045 [Pseudomonas sp. JQ170]|uniref:hypothetical protein n=1 Tax=unclassified Pseudomonas TaxID=196821 RepID=UPI00264F3026|nr:MULTISPECIES: hypothetical protein [unclassified Pseudomonas]MDN7140201.1 hypothetical protein [Pseudomonas sp. JQ170]WRO76609.1 hypothetical protein U9R80_02685 [Pseudomonas sp. 170C]